MNSVWVSFGIFSTYLLNFFGLHWRTIGFIYSAMSFLCVFAVYIIPESPLWTLTFCRRKKDVQEETLKSLKWLYKDEKVSTINIDFFYYNLNGIKKFSNSLFFIHFTDIAKKLR